MSRAHGKSVLGLLVFLVIVAIVGAFVAFGPPGLYAKTETPEFCASCHVVQSEYEST